MKKALTFALAFSCLALWLSRSSSAQDNVTRTAGSLAAEGGSREQDKLIGPVRRVRVEIARILPKNGNWVEGPREPLGIATYDPAGRKIDSVVYPAEHTSPSGKEQYLYDQKGNVVEMTLLSSDGSMLSKESYKYEFDQLGNWTKMSSSVAVYENGKIIFEPTGITYRTISYYYSQAIEKLSASLPKSRAVSTPSTSSTVPISAASPPDSSQPPTTVSVNTTSQDQSEVVNDHAKTEMLTAPASVAPSKNSAAAPENTADTSNEIRTAPDNAAPTSVVQYVTEEDLRSAAVELPAPEYSDAALRAQTSGKVKVQILVDETGHVTTAQAISGNPLLVASAEVAARKASFSLAKVPSGATKVYGVITYEFVPPKTDSEPSPAMSPTSERMSPQPDKRKTETEPVAETATNVESKPKTAAASYDQGVTFQATGRYAEAAEAFNHTIKIDPNDAKAYARLGMAYSALEKHKEAISVYKMAEQIDRSILGAPAYYMWGHSYLALGKNADALSAFKHGLQITRAEAIDNEQQPAQRYPSLEQLHYGMAIAYLGLRRFGDSIDELKQVVKLNPKNAEAHYTLVVAYISNGNRKEAEAHQKTLSTLNPALAQKLVSAMAGTSIPPGCLNIACRQ